MPVTLLFANSFLSSKSGTLSLKGRAKDCSNRLPLSMSINTDVSATITSIRYSSAVTNALLPTGLSIRLLISWMEISSSSDAFDSEIAPSTSAR